MRPSRQTVFTLFSIAVTVIVLGYLFSRVSLEDVLDIIINMDVQGLLMFVLLSLSMSLFRTWRYLLLLNISGLGVRRITLFLVILVRNLFSDLLPARIGTLVYIYLVNTRLGIPLSAATSSFATAFLFDILVLAPLIVIAAILSTGVTSLSPMVMTVTGIGLGFICMALFRMLPTIMSTTAGTVNWLRFLKPESRQWLDSTLKDTAIEVRRYQKAGIYSRLLGLSLAVRLCKYGSLYFLLYALLAPRGFGLADLEIPGVFLGLVVPEFAASLPISGIAGFGAYEGAWIMIFKLLGFPSSLAELTSIAHHGFTQVYGYCLGLIALLVLMMIKPLPKQKPESIQ